VTGIRVFLNVGISVCEREDGGDVQIQNDQKLIWKFQPIHSPLMMMMMIWMNRFVMEKKSKHREVVELT
jgi:hypothetical protein